MRGHKQNLPLPQYLPLWGDAVSNQHLAIPEYGTRLFYSGGLAQKKTHAFLI